ncbi:unnamed protein product [Phytophthora fragariaefolia]|uniref:Unnamed protein product n=1 Tax=Phytophthora fragariaefolia TaxID=1490495 RepID=A0A9W6TRX3_9STRA|nr:unnamed protein product [Phytophthora fragariaefolia]
MGNEHWRGVDVLLGMNFMYSAGVRLCAREGLVKLPDEGTVLLAGRTADHMGRGLDLAVTPKRALTKVIYAAKSWPVAVKVVNVSGRTVWIDSRTAIARIVEFGYFPTVGRFVRPGLRRYKEWQVLIYENTNSREVRKGEERLTQLRRGSEPPCGQAPEYQWRRKRLVGSPTGSAQVHMVHLQPRPNVEVEKALAKTDVQLSETKFSGTSVSEGTESREAKLIGGS